MAAVDVDREARGPLAAQLRLGGAVGVSTSWAAVWQLASR